MRLDEHFLEHPTVYAELANVLKEIISETKWYPHPLLIWKAKTWKRFEERSRSNQQDVVPNEPVIIDKQPVVDNNESPNRGEQFTESSPLTPELVIETLITGTTNPMIRSALKQHVIIQEITDTTIGAVVINEQFYHTLSKAETSRELDNILLEMVKYT